MIHRMKRQYSLSNIQHPIVSSIRKYSSRRFRQHVNPLANKFHRPIQLPLWDQVLANPSLPIHLDIGCAHGKYLIQLAEANQAKINYIGIEIRKNVIEYAQEQLKERNIRNIALLNANMNVQQKYLLPSLPAKVQSVSIFHPDPWMKKKHLKRRLVTNEFVTEMAELLDVGTPIYVQTDVLELFHYMNDIFKESGYYDSFVLKTNPLGLPTDRETLVLNKGGKILKDLILTGDLMENLSVSETSVHDSTFFACWQIIDSLYPTGGFAHSIGLEAAVQENLVSAKNPSSLHNFLISTIHQTANFALPIVFSAHSACIIDSTESQDSIESSILKLVEINSHANALISNHVARKASLAQGAALLRLSMTTYNEKTTRLLLTNFKIALKKSRGGMNVHHSLMFGLVCRLLQIDVATCQRMYLFVVARDVLSAATRLNLIGPLESARILHEKGALIESIYQKKRDRDIEKSYSSAPVLDLIQGMHDQLYSRIFNS